MPQVDVATVLFPRRIQNGRHSLQARHHQFRKVPLASVHGLQVLNQTRGQTPDMFRIDEIPAVLQSDVEEKRARKCCHTMPVRGDAYHNSRHVWVAQNELDR